MSTAKAWNETVIIPTYEIGKAEKNPIFLEKRVYQGSSGVVYPYPVIEKISDEKTNKEWHAVYLENQYLKIMILPELGGRIQMAYDKIKQRHFVYYNQVIKPALVGLTGPWISGGIEFNWPQHHRPSTYLPVDSMIENNEDGSVTVWCSEVERMFRTKGMTGFTLYPDKAYLEIKVKLYNRTNHPQTFLWWANPAVKVNDDYQSVFPPDVNAVFDHGKRDVSEFPIAKGTYYKIDYSPGTDISRYKNIPVPTSYMAIKSDYDFVGGYENDSKGGLLHVANHHVSPGKKQWTWGNGDFGKAWDRNLTDEDGPYIELMCGVYTDNQPDFSWLMPGEEKAFNQYFMPYSDLGVVKNATKEALLNLEVTDGKANLKIYTTAAYPVASVSLLSGDRVLLFEKVDFEPWKSYENQIVLPEGIDADHLKVVVKDATDTVLVDWCNEKGAERPIPEPAKAAKEPEAIDSNEQLYLTGLHLEQYRHATYDPRPYYEEALKRDPKDSRCNNALGLWYLRRGQFERAEAYFRKAIDTLTERNPNPIDGEAIFNLGICLRYLGKTAEAYEAFYKSVWNSAWMDAGYFQLARIDCISGKWDSALELINRSLIRNWHHHEARQLKVSILRHSGKKDAALKLVNESLELDSFNFSLYFEQYLLTNNEAVLDQMKSLIRANIHSYIEYALDYGWAGLYDEAIQLLKLGVEEQGQKAVFPLAYYYLGYFSLQANQTNQANDYFKQALKANPDYCFPNQPEAIIALKTALLSQPDDFKALYYLGNFWYGHRNYPEAIDCWKRSIQINSDFPTSWRNYALACFNKLGNTGDAVSALEKAFELDPTDSRILMELDQLYKRLCYSHRKRLHFLEKYPDLVAQRDDLYLERVTLYNQLGDYQKAIDLIDARQFHPWEGGEGKVPAQYQIARVELARQLIAQKEYRKAKELLEECLVYPDNLGEGKLINAQENDFNYYLGCVYDGLNDPEKAENYWNLAEEGNQEPAAAIFYNDQKPDKIYYQGLALLKLNRRNDANVRFSKLLEYGEKHLDDQVKLDYFAVSLPDLLIWEDDLTYRNRIHCYYMMGLGYTGLGSVEKGQGYLKKAFEMDVNHQGVQSHLVHEFSHID